MTGLVKDARTELAREVAQGVRDGDGWPPESTDSINDASRKVVDAMVAEHGEAWLGHINLHGDDRGKPEKAMWRWDGSLVLNFSAAFVAPRFDEELLRLIMERDAGPYTTTAADVPKVEAIIERLHAIGGVHLFWT